MKSSSSASEPRATVFSTSGRSERPSSKNGEGVSGRFFGWLAMSCRRYSQPALKTRQAAAQAAMRQREVLVIGHLGNMMGVEALQKARGLRQMKLPVAGLDANKKAVRGCMREAVDVENRMVRLGQPIQSEHSEYRGERCAENSQLKGNGNEGRPAIERAAADVHRISDRRYPVLKTKTAQPPCQAAKQSNGRHEVALQAERFGQAFDGKRRIGIETVIAGFTNFFDRMDKLLRSFELTHHAVDMGTLQMHYFSSSEVSATSSRISAMEIAGRTRTKRKSKVTNIPMVPMNVAQSQTVGL